MTQCRENQIILYIQSVLGFYDAPVDLQPGPIFPQIVDSPSIASFFKLNST